MYVYLHPSGRGNQRTRGGRLPRDPWAPIYDKSGKERIGRFDLLCAITDPADEPSEKAHMAQCTKTFTLPGGQISAVGPEAHPLADGVNPISGGTGKYAGVGGEERFEVRGNKVIDTFHFIE